MRWPVCITALLLVGCDPVPPTGEPAEFAAIIYPEDNPTTRAGLGLGRRLFYDPVLSVDSTVSCASCHRPELAFSDGLAVSRGVRGLAGTRNTPGLANVGYLHQTMFWDGRADNLEAQALHPVGTDHEMGGDWPSVVARLEASQEYRHRFSRAFGHDPITPRLVGRALAQFQRSFISANSKYDRVKRGETAFTDREAVGEAIFFDFADDPEGGFAGLPRGECAHCHTPPHFTNQRFENNGLDPEADLADSGRAGVSGNVFDRGRFRNPGLRNVALTTPYMHDGRFATLEEVVAHYNSGGHYAENRSPNIAELGMTGDQRAALVAFLHTLTDTSFVNNPVYRAGGDAGATN